MIKTHKLAMTGLASLVVAISALALPMSHSAGAISLEDMKKPQKTLTLEQGSNEAVDVTTELDCSRHSLKAKVTNKTDAEITPEVTFNDEESDTSFPIDPGKTANYYFNYSGNDLLVETKVAVDTYDPVVVSQMLNCSEPVSFKVTETSKSAVVGDLRNNSTIMPQAAYTRVGSGDIRLEILQPGEVRTVALPFHATENQQTAMVTIATWAGFESSYMVDLEDDLVPLKK